MSEIQSCFRRCEKKYLLTHAQYQAMRLGMAPYMEPDAYPRYSISNIYYDTEHYDLIRTSLKKPVYKEKLRVRSYGKAAADSPVFVELKKKFESVVYKRRLALPHREAMDALENGLPLPADGQIGREIAAFRAFYGPTLKPAMYLSYEREAYYPTDGADFRLTLDENILWRTDHLDLAASPWGSPVIGPDQVLMELKTPGSIPLWMVRFLSENRIYQTSFSKYGAAFLQWQEEAAGAGGRLYA